MMLATPGETPRTVSVCIPTYNGAAFLGEAIDSVLCQGWHDYDLVVCDNASSDETPAICARYAEQGLRYHRFEQLVGQAGNWNRCCDLAHGRFVVLLHADDALERNFLGRAVEFLEHHPHVVLVHCGVRHVTADGREIAREEPSPADRVVPGEEFFFRMLLDGCLVNPAGVMIRAAALRRAGRFSERIRWGVDWHMWLRLCLQGDVGYIAGLLARYRHHAGSGTAAVLGSGRLASDELWVTRDVVGLRGLPEAGAMKLIHRARAGIAHRVWCHAEQALLEGRRAAAFRGLIDAVRMDKHLLLQRRAWGLAAGVAFGVRAYRRLRLTRGRR
jgi:glycosyltransferase involved in cell wall biosynthesis